MAWEEKQKDAERPSGRSSLQVKLKLRVDEDTEKTCLAKHILSEPFSNTKEI